MNLSLDSHAFLWFVANDQRLSTSAKAEIENPVNRKWVSVGSLWEITIKVAIGKLSLVDPVAPFLARELLSNKFQILDIKIDHLAALSSLPFYHRDPFDRLLVSQALSDSFSLVSADTALDAYGITRIW